MKFVFVFPIFQWKMFWGSSVIDSFGAQSKNMHNAHLIFVHSWNLRRDNGSFVRFVHEFYSSIIMKGLCPTYFIPPTTWLSSRPTFIPSLPQIDLPHSIFERRKKYIINYRSQLFNVLYIRIAFVSERPRARPRRAPAPPPAPSATSGARASRQDARRTQADLLRLLRAFGAPEAPRATAHLADIRQQQDDLARLHFK